MDPTDINKHTDLVAALNRLRGTRSYSALSKAAAALRPRDGRHPDLPTSTISDLLNGKSIPSVDTVVTFLAACGVDVGDAQRPWLDAMARVATEHQRRPSGVVRVREARPRLLGVHAAIQVDRQFTEHGQARASDELPPYVPRDLDTDLRTKLADARHRGDFVLLVGGSSVGKSRTLFEAVTSVLTEWWLFHPADTDAVRKFATAPTAQTVVWLDELQNYLNAPDSLPAATIRDLIKAGVIVVATLWPGEYATRTTPRTSGPPDPYANDRDLLGTANVITVADTFSAQELRQAEHLAESDGRIRVALDTPDAGFTQVMAAGPELVRWWKQAPTDQCYGKAIITAALDARRVGSHAPLTRAYLEAAAPGYLSPTDIARAQPGWLDHALTYATERLHGATATLSPVSTRLGHTDGYEVADYLHQHALRVRRTIHLPDSTWRALVDHHHANDTRRLADNARRRGRDQEAETLYRRLVYDHGDRAALLELAGLLTKQGRGDDAITLLWGGAEAGNGNVILESAGLAVTGPECRTRRDAATTTSGNASATDSPGPPPKASPPTGYATPHSPGSNATTATASPAPTPDTPTTADQPPPPTSKPASKRSPPPSPP